MSHVRNASGSKSSLMSSFRSTATADSDEGSMSVASYAIKNLHGKLVRSHKRRDPYHLYDVIKVLGDGSMGSVALVQRKHRYKGGSARVTFVQENDRENCCFGLFSWMPCPLPSSIKNGAFHPMTDTTTISDCTSNDTDESQDDSQNALGGDSSGRRSSNPMQQQQQQSTIQEEEEEEETQPAGANTSEDGQIRNTSSSNIEQRKFGHGGNKQLRHSASSMINYATRKDHKYALKSIHMDRVNDVFIKELMNEISILQALDHPNIVKAIETFEYHKQVYLVLELCNGGDLYARDPYTEEQAKGIVRSVLDAVVYMHSHEIIHRDLKYENIMFATPDSSAVKIIDFGLGKKYAHEEHLHDAVGTVYTMAPEVLMGDYDNKVDLWSVGVIAFMLLSSSLPFYGKTRQHVVRRIVAGKFAFKGRRWRSVSEDARRFVLRLLQVDPTFRPSGEQGLKLPWLHTEDFWGSTRNLDTEALMDNVQATLETFASYGRLKKLALLVVAYKSTSEEIGYLRKIFRKFDTTSDGDISLDDFKIALKPYNYTDEDLESMFNAIDIDGTGVIHYSEFLAASIEAHGSIDEERIAEAFDLLDNDDSGFITVDNLKSFLGEQLPHEFLTRIIDEADLTRDSKISYAEFLALWNEDDDFRKQKTLEGVGNRRRFGSRDGDLSRQSSCSDMDESTTFSVTSSDLGGGDYFFGMEKDKSVRGVWL